MLLTFFYLLVLGHLIIISRGYNKVSFNFQSLVICQKGERFILQTSNPRLPYLHFIYISIVLAAVLCICLLIQQQDSLRQDLYHWQDKAEHYENELNKYEDELNKINRYAAHYKTTPEIVATVFRESEKHKIDPLIMLELIRAESNFNPKARSKYDARGLCQIRPVTAKSVAKRAGVEYRPELLLDPEYSIILGTFHLAELVEMFEQDYHKALTAYNRGIKGMTDYTKRTGSPVSSYSKRIRENSLAVAM